MNETKDKRPSCFGILDTVFPQGEDGLRHSPETCLLCTHKTKCLRSAMKGNSGLKVKEERVDRVYESGNMTFLERWSQKKYLKTRLKKKTGNE